MAVHVSQAVLIPIFLKLPKELIVEFKFTLESYEGLGIVRTLDSKRGEIVVLALSDTEETVRELIEGLKAPLGLREIPAPPSVENDWLLESSELL